MFYRGRRLRKNATIRNLMAETKLHKEDFIFPIFVVEGENIKNEISSLPNNYHWSVDRLHEVVAEMNEVEREERRKKDDSYSAIDAFAKWYESEETK